MVEERLVVIKWRGGVIDKKDIDPNSASFSYGKEPTNEELLKKAQEESSMDGLRKTAEQNERYWNNVKDSKNVGEDFKQQTFNEWQNAKYRYEEAQRTGETGIPGLR